MGRETSQFKRKNDAALTHGGAAAVKRIQHGEALTGPARQAEISVHAELETEGRYHVVRRNAARLQAATDCYWSVLTRLMDLAEQKGGADGAIVKLTNTVKTFGWLTSASLRAWQQVKEEEKDSDRQTLEILLSQEVSDGPDPEQ